MSTGRKAEDAQPMTSDGLHQYACVVCQQRKVKCDRLDPSCSNCIKGYVECVYRAPPPPRRRKRKLSGPLLQSRLKKCEELLQRHGIALGDVPIDPPAFEGAAAKANRTNSNLETFSAPQGRGSIQLSDGTKGKRSLAQNDLWEDLHEVHQHTPLQDSANDYDDDVTSDSSEDPEDRRQGHEGDWVWGASPQFESELRLPPEHTIQILWGIFKENVNPITKMIHVPTVDGVIQKCRRPLEEISRSEKALIFAIFAAAVNSMSEMDCETSFGEDRSTALRRYRGATKQALTNAKFLSTTSLTVLQAFVIFLMSMRLEYDPPALWSLTGIAIRICQRMGIHRSQSDRQISLFEEEMRNRLWFQLVILDAQTGELSGAEITWDGILGEARVPLNVDDEALHPDMKELPQEVEGATEMIFTLIRFEFGISMQRIGLLFTPVSEESRGTETMGQRDRAIDEVEEIFGRKFLRYCDPLIPLHFLVILAARGMICRARVMARHPRQYKDRGASMSQEERDSLFLLCLQAVEYESLGQATKILRGFQWHMQHQVQFAALIYILSELRERTTGPKSEKAWKQVEEIFRNHPELMKEKRRRLFWALGSLTIAAWERKEAQQQQQQEHGAQLETPQFISELRSQRMKPIESKVSKKAIAAEQQSDTPSESLVPSSIYPNIPHPLDVSSNSLPLSPSRPIQSDFDGSFPYELDLGFNTVGYSPLDWSAWDDMLLDFER